MHALARGSTVFLRHPTLTDHAELMELRRASWELHGPWEPAPETDTDPFGPAAFESFLASADTTSSQKHLVCRNADGAIVSYVGLSQIFMGPFCSAYLGYWTGEPFVRRGYGGEGVALCVERAFTRLGLHRVEANIIPGNRASIALVRRLGFKREGYSPRYLKIAGRWQDHERWALTVEDWR